MIIPTCGVLKEHDIYVGLIHPGIYFTLIDHLPQIIVERENKV